jgi:hypothetical protein
VSDPLPTILCREDACTRAEFESDARKCSHAIAGSAVVSTPLLRDPLRGRVYFVKNGHPIPDLFVALRAQVAFDLIGGITIPGSNASVVARCSGSSWPVETLAVVTGGAETVGRGDPELPAPRTHARKTLSSPGED